MSCFCFQRLADAERPLIIVGSSILQRDDGDVIHKLVTSLCEQIRVSPGRDPEWKIYNLLHRVCFTLNTLTYCKMSNKHHVSFVLCRQVASQVGALDLGYTAGVDALKKNPPKLLVMLQADEGKISRQDLGDDCSVIYIGAFRRPMTSLTC